MSSPPPKAPLPQTITLGTGFSTYAFLKNTNIRTTAPTILRKGDPGNHKLLKLEGILEAGSYR